MRRCYGTTGNAFRGIGSLQDGYPIRRPQTGRINRHTFAKLPAVRLPRPRRMASPGRYSLGASTLLQQAEHIGSNPIKPNGI